MDLHWIAPRSPHPSYDGVPEQDAALQLLTRVKQKQSITSLSLLAMLHLTAQDMFGFLCTLPAHAELLIQQTSQFLLLRAALSLFSAQIWFVFGIALSYMQDLGIGLVELCGAPTGPLL